MFMCWLVDVCVYSYVHVLYMETHEGTEGVCFLLDLTNVLFSSPQGLPVYLAGQNQPNLASFVFLF